MIAGPKRGTTVYPIYAWALTPEFKLKKAIIMSGQGQYYLTSTNAYADPTKLYASKAEAVEGGRKRLIALEAKLKKQRYNLKKRAETLEKQAFTI